jgi:drug/metabolite transporter (DMT)-like permease
VKNLAEDLIYRAGRTAAELRWTGAEATDHFDIVEAGLAGDVRAAGTILPTPVGSIVKMVFRLERKQFIWDLLLFVLGWALISVAPRATLYVAAGVAILFVFTQLRRPAATTLSASRLVGLVQDATTAEISKVDGALIKSPERG